MTDAAQDREEFEQHVAKKRWSIERDPDYPEEYKSDNVNCYWNGWQASAARERDAILVLATNAREGLALNHGGEEIDRLIEAIRARGKEPHV